MRQKSTSLNFRLSIIENQACWLRHSIQYCQLEALYFLPLLLSRKRLLERLDSPSGVFDQSFALDDNGTDIHCAKVQRESARYIADRPGHDFEKPSWRFDRTTYSDVRSETSLRVIRLDYWRMRPFRAACNAGRINRTLLLQHTYLTVHLYIYWRCRFNYTAQWLPRYAPLHVR